MKAKRLIQGAAAALIGVGSLAAHAEGLYVGGALGGPHYNDPVNGIAGSGSGTAGKVFGGVQVNPNFGVEAGIFDLGHIDDANGKVDLRGLYLDAVGKVEFAPNWSLTGSAGVADGRFKTSSGNDHSPALKLGVGVEYAMTRNASLDVGYDHYRFSDAFDGKANVSMPFVGVKVGF